MYDLSVYGHLTVDRIFEDFHEHRTLGAIGNFWEACLLTNHNLFINIQPTSIGEAIIYVNKENCTRQGRGVLNLKTRSIKSTESSKWNHIMYLNKIEDPSFINNLDGIISADLTSGNMNNLQFLSTIDYLFVSDEDMFMGLQELATKVKGWVILHSPHGSVCHNGKDSFKTKTEVVDNLNVLGAGDFFAAGFISHMLKTNDKIKECVSFAHKNTTKILLRRNNG